MQLYKTHPYGQQHDIGQGGAPEEPVACGTSASTSSTYYVPNNMAIFISGDIDIDETIAIIDEHTLIGWEPKPICRISRRRGTRRPSNGREQVER